METATGQSTDRSVGLPVDTGAVSAAGRRLSYAEYGDPAGRPVVVLHGTPGSSRLGGLFAPAAAAAGVRLLAVDRPGYGDSDPWPARSISDIGGGVAAVLDDVSVDVAGIVGFSGGGPHALAVGATHGERVTSIDVISGSTPPDLDTSPTMQRLLGRMAASTPRLLSGLFSTQAWVASHVSPVFLSQYTDAERSEFDDGVVDLLTAEFVDSVGGWRQGVATEFRLLAHDWGFSPSDVDQPVRFWHGEADRNVPVAGVQQLSQRLPNSDLTTVPEGDHLTTLLECRHRVVDHHTNRTP